MADNRFFESIQLNGFLSFAPDSPPFDMKPLNVLIGPNGAGKTNLIEAFELLRSTPGDLAKTVREGDGASEWIWKGKGGDRIARINAVIGPAPTKRFLRYKLAFTVAQHRLELIDEAVEEPTPGRAVPGQKQKPDVFFYYRFQQGRPVINVKGNGKGTGFKERRLERDSLIPDQSVLSQRKDPDLYPELTWAGQAFGEIQTFREWRFGQGSAVRLPQPADQQADRLLSEGRNLALVLSQIQLRHGKEIDRLIKRFLPRFDQLVVTTLGGTVQFFLREEGLDEPIPAKRLSDGTLRFLAILASLLAPKPPRLLCIEEPEMGLHPDALALLAEMLVEASSRMQLVVTTHSEALISALTDHVDSVVVCENIGNGTTLNRLDAEDLSFWLDKYKLGEIWRIGEIGGNL
ncbi:MAG: hypothetical protein RLY86_1129 [Pseudomonadota bacterium]|jgi:predicted ATPase